MEKVYLLWAVQHHLEDFEFLCGIYKTYDRAKQELDKNQCNYAVDKVEFTISERVVIE